MRFTFPSLISASIKLARRYKDREQLVRLLLKHSILYNSDIHLSGDRLGIESLKYP